MKFVSSIKICQAVQNIVLYSTLKLSSNVRVFIRTPISVRVGHEKGNIELIKTDTGKRPMTIRKVVIVGGGTSGWMTAAMLSQLTKNKLEIVLIESESIRTIGVGEATIPAIKRFNQLLDINEVDFIKATKGTFKLGIQFQDWGQIGESYVHGFGTIGRQWDWLSFYQYWLHMHKNGKTEHLDNYSINTLMALEHKFCPAQPQQTKSPLSEIAYAFHFDSGLYGQFLRRYSEERGVKRSEGKIVAVEQDPTTQFITHVAMDNGQKVSGDLFIDCSGMRALLIGQSLQVGYEDWSHWLPCDSAMALPSEADPSLPSYTRSKAHSAGWQWKIPLQHRTGNGHVFSSNFISDDAACDMLFSHLDTAAIGDINHIRFKTGKRTVSWHKNCVAVGLSAGFLEPLESTSLYLVQTAILRLIKLFPDAKFHNANIEQFNKETNFEIERIRDFIIAHYKVTRRDDSEFWRYCQHMDIPDSLREKIDIFSAYGRVNREADELFREESWVQVLIGQGLIPQDYDPLVDLKTSSDIAGFVNNTKDVIRKCLIKLPSHQAFISQHCQA